MRQRATDLDSLDKGLKLRKMDVRCETWSLILREEHRLRVLENRVLRRMFGLERDEVIGGWRIFSKYN
jgi:hypothetical protein